MINFLHLEQGFSEENSAWCFIFLLFVKRIYKNEKRITFFAGLIYKNEKRTPFFVKIFTFYYFQKTASTFNFLYIFAVKIEFVRNVKIIAKGAELIYKNVKRITKNDILFSFSTILFTDRTIQKSLKCAGTRKLAWERHYSLFFSQFQR